MPPERSPSGYRVMPGHGPRIRSDIIEVMVFRAPEGSGPELLQIKRARDPLKDTWQPVMGHIEPGETAVQAALRELREETGLACGADVPSAIPSAPSSLPPVPSAQSPVPSPFLALWALEQVHPYFIAAIDSIVLPARFAVQASPSWTPTLNAEHTHHRWVPASDAAQWFMWPGQAAAARELITHLLTPGSLCREALQLPIVGHDAP